MAKRFSKKIHMYSLQGEYIKSFNSVKEASTFSKTTISNIATSARSGGIGQSGGYLWSYERVEKLPEYDNYPGKSKRRNQKCNVYQSIKLKTPERIREFFLEIF